MFGVPLACKHLSAPHVRHGCSLGWRMFSSSAFGPNPGILLDHASVPVCHS